MDDVEKGFLDLVLDIEGDIIIMDSLQEELLFFNELAQVPGRTPEEDAMRKDELDHAFSQYHSHKDYLLERLEEWNDHTKRMNFPVDINFYRILKQLRWMEENGY